MTEATRVGVVQMTSNDEVDRNLDIAERLVRRGVKDGSRLLVLPECFASLGREEDKFAVAETLPVDGLEPGPILGRCMDWAKELGVELVLGGFWETGPDERHPYNACLHVDATGALRAAYRKIHLFDVDLADGTKLLESETVGRGDPAQAVVTDTAFGKLGLSVCYDLRFPQLYFRLVDAGAIAHAIPAAFTLHTGKDHWHVLQRARAIETQSYVLAAAQFGRHVRADGTGHRVSYGHALVVDPWGTVLAECGEGEGVAIATVDPAVVERVRAQLPSLRHRRL
ncbi:MAG: carbon-nitrogen hydrolase family protein [Deltaproteobacteria bacterium]|nr:carbon-nitrogen hydrolase family protein [Deltaproteobacteria bacterium]